MLKKDTFRTFKASFLRKSRTSYKDYHNEIIRQSLCLGCPVGSNNGRLVCSLNILTILSWRRWQQKPQNPLSTCLLFYNRRLTESRHCTMPLSFADFRSRPCNRICSESILQGIKDKARKRAPPFARFERCLGISPQLHYGYVDSLTALTSQRIWLIKQENMVVNKLTDIASRVNGDSFSGQRIHLLG